MAGFVNPQSTEDQEPEPNSPELTAVVLTLNESDHISACLSTLSWADRLVVLDSGSTDNTASLARGSGAEVITSDFHDYAQQRNAALEEIDSEWIFFVDADERATPELAAEIAEVTTERPESGWYVPRHNYIFGALTLGGGWFPDYQLRLFRNGCVRYKKPVHEIAVVNGQVGYLNHPIIHYNYRDPAHFHEKQRAYIDYDAQELKRDGINPKVYTPLGQAVRHFWWRFFVLRGYRDGFHGLRLSGYLSYYEWKKYRQLRAITR